MSYIKVPDLILSCFCLNFTYILSINVAVACATVVVIVIMVIVGWIPDDIKMSIFLTFYFEIIKVLIGSNDYVYVHIS